MKHQSLWAAMALMLFAAPMSFAGSQGDNNGKPFQELTAIIEGNRALIDANSADIATLQSAVSDISDDITDIQSDLSDLEARVAANEGSIVDLQGRLGAVEVDVDSLITGLAQLRADHDADMVDINAAIAAAEARIAALESDLQDLTVALNLRLAAIESDVADNAVAIDAMILELTTTTAKALANMVAINDLQSQVDALVTRTGAHDVDIDNLRVEIYALEADVLALNGTVEYLESLHFDPQCNEPYTTISDPSRNVTAGGPYSCDNGLATGWYRFTGAAGTHIPTSVVPIFHCGTHAPGWMNGILPENADGVVTRQVCYNWSGNSCNWSNNVEVVACDGFYLYKLSPSPVCNLRYCGTN